MKNGRPWNVGIRDPRGTPDDYFATLAVTDVSVSTSGDYESFFISEGVRYHHILDPRTGMPSRGLRSATVICPDATLADGLSTAIMVMGAERGIALADSLPEVEAVVVDTAGELRVTAGLKDRLVIQHQPRR
jgi:thiamine biosynthesis lipoprotein